MPARFPPSWVGSSCGISPPGGGLGSGRSRVASLLFAPFPSSHRSLSLQLQIRPLCLIRARGKVRTGHRGSAGGTGVVRRGCRLVLMHFFVSYIAKYDARLYLVFSVCARGRWVVVGVAGFEPWPEAGGPDEPRWQMGIRPRWGLAP